MFQSGKGKKMPNKTMKHNNVNGDQKSIKKIILFAPCHFEMEKNMTEIKTSNMKKSV
jgi:hypothetical protein